MEFEEPLILKLEPCSFCGRKFAWENLYRHKNICQKTSCRRPVFDSSKQRSVQGAKANIKDTSTAIPCGKTSKHQNWRQKHDEFIKTVRAAREVTAAIKQGKPLPPPSFSTVNPDYIQCPHCMRRFNKNAAERHIVFCAEQSKRMCNKKPIGNFATRQAAARASARHYRPPVPCKKDYGIVKRASVFNNHLSTLTARTSSAPLAQHKILKPAWGSTVDEHAEQNKVTKTGLHPSTGNSYNASCYSEKKASKPGLRKMAGKKILTKQSWSNDTKLFKDSSTATTDHSNSMANIGMPYRDSAHENSKFCNSEADFYGWLQPDELHAKSRPQQMHAKFCHECGTQYPVYTAKFCCECGMKRVIIS